MWTIHLWIRILETWMCFLAFFLYLLARAASQVDPKDGSHMLKMAQPTNRLWAYLVDHHLEHHWRKKKHLVSSCILRYHSYSSLASILTKTWGVSKFELNQLWKHLVQGPGQSSHSVSWCWVLIFKIWQYNNIYCMTKACNYMLRMMQDSKRSRTWSLSRNSCSSGPIGLCIPSSSPLQE